MNFWLILIYLFLYSYQFIKIICYNLLIISIKFGSKEALHYFVDNTCVFWANHFNRLKYLHIPDLVTWLLLFFLYIMMMFIIYFTLHSICFNFNDHQISSLNDEPLVVIKNLLLLFSSSRLIESSLFKLSSPWNQVNYRSFKISSFISISPLFEQKNGQRLCHKILYWMHRLIKFEVHH